MRTRALLGRRPRAAMGLVAALGTLVLTGEAEAICPTRRTFRPGTSIAATLLTPALTRMPVVADFDGDGRPDFAAHDSEYFRFYSAVKKDTRATTVGVYLNRSTPGSLAFAGARELTAGEPAGCFNCVNETDLQAADLDGDGATDLVASLSANDAVYVFFNDLRGPSGAFLPPVKVRVGEDPVWVRVGDFDGDAVLDIATVGLERRSVLADVWNLSLARGLGGRSFAPAETLVLDDAARLGFTDHGNESPYERQESVVSVVGLPVGAPAGEDVLLTSAILTGPPRLWFVAPGATKFSLLPQRLEQPAFSGYRTGTAPVAFFEPGFQAIGIGSLQVGRRSTFLRPDWSNPSNLPLDDFVRDNLGSLGRLEAFRLADFDRDTRPDVVALFSHAALVGFGVSLAGTHPFAALVSGSGDVQTVPMFARQADVSLFHSLAVADFDGDGLLDLLSGSDDAARPERLMIYTGSDSAQAGPVSLEQLKPASAKEGAKVLFDGRGFLNPTPITRATLAEMGGKGRWVVPVTRADVISDTSWLLSVPVLGDAAFWSKHPAGVRVAVTVDNPCNTSNALTLEVQQGP